LTRVLVNILVVNLVRLQVLGESCKLSLSKVVLEQIFVEIGHDLGGPRFELDNTVTRGVELQLQVRYRWLLFTRLGNREK